MLEQLLLAALANFDENKPNEHNDQIADIVMDLCVLIA